MLDVDLQKILSPFGLKSKPATFTVFSNDISMVAMDIREEQLRGEFDHRPWLPERDHNFPYLLTEQYRVGYACFKYAVAKVLKPSKIIEIGIGAGTGAIAMLSAHPEAFYVGVDDNSKCAHDDWDFTYFVKQQLDKLGAKYEIHIQDSMTLQQLPHLPADLVHVDGDHSYKNAFNDSLLAFNSRAKWILVDDSRDLTVVRAAFDALEKSAPSLYEWTYFEDTWTGNLLFCRKDA